MIDRGIMHTREMRRTISIFGLDIIQEDHAKNKIVEINGAHCGVNGLKKLNSRDIDREILWYLNRNHKEDIVVIDKDEDDYNDDDDFFEVITPDEALEEGHFRWAAPKDVRWLMGPAFPPAPDKDFECILLNRAHSSIYIVDETEVLPINPYAIEVATEDKFIIDTLFHGMKEFRPETCILSEGDPHGNARKLIEESSAGYFFMKPTLGSCGSDIVIVRRKEFYDKDEFVDPYSLYYKKNESQETVGDLILEAGIKSKKIRSRQTGKDHYGCMRYVVVVESNKGNIHIEHFGGYWRLAPKPIASRDLEGRLIANLSREAIPELPSPEELESTRKAIDSFMPTLYQRMLRLPINEKPDGISLLDYCY